MLILIILALTACLPRDTKGDTGGLVCGTGTHEADGACIADSGLVCGDGTHEVDGACVPDSATDSGSDTDTGSSDTGSSDTGGDSGTDTSVDSGADSGTDTDTGSAPAVSGLLVWASVVTGCNDFPAAARLDYTDITAGSGSQELNVTTAASETWVSSIVSVAPGDALTYSAYYEAECIGSSGGSPTSALMGAGQILVVYADGSRSTGSATTWTEGVDYSATDVLVAFEAGTSASYAQTILEDHPVNVLAQVSDDPPTFLVDDDAGTHSILLAASLQGETRVTFAIPSTD